LVEANSQSLLGKAGLSWQSKNLTAGLTITTPKLQGTGEGRTSYETFLAGIDTTGDGTNDDIYIINNQDNLDAEHKTPLSIGIGTGIKIGRSLIHLSGEWFNRIPGYTIMQSEPFVGQSTGQAIQLTVVEKAESVFNVGGGFEIYLNPKMSFFGSFATDFSAVSSDINRLSDLKNTFSNTTLQSDIYHYGFGFDIKTKSVELTLGATYATTSETFERTIEIDEGMDSTTSTSEIILTRWRFLIGFEFPFLDKAKEKLEGSQE